MAFEAWLHLAKANLNVSLGSIQWHSDDSFQHRDSSVTWSILSKEGQKSCLSHSLFLVLLEKTGTLEAYRPALIPVASFSCVKQCKFLKNYGLVSSSIYWR